MSSISYKIYQDNRKNGTNLWYAKAVTRDTVNLKAISARIEQNCSMKQSDVLAYLTELIEVITRKLQQGFKVELGDIGLFSIGIKSKGAIAEKDYKPQEYVKGYRINFLPKGTVVKSNNGRAVTRSTIDSNITYVKAN